MEKLDIEALSKTRFKSNVRTDNPILEEAKKLEKGEGLKVLKTDYTNKTAFPAFIRQSFRKERTEKILTVRRLVDEDGWVIIRIK